MWAGPDPGAEGSGRGNPERAIIAHHMIGDGQMFRTTLAAAAALTLAAPAMAQTSTQLTQAPWACRMTSLVGEPGGDLVINFERNGGLYASFYVEVPQDQDVIAVEFDATGTWSLAGAVISMDVGATELVGGWYNDEELDAETMAELEISLGAELSNFSGESTIAYIADHAMVLDEPDTSISCWRE